MAETSRVRSGKRAQAAPVPEAATLLAWYDVSARVLPWRARGGARPDPYRVWLSEIMLQQTQVKTVLPYYAKFLARWPDVRALANARTEEVMSAWAGLGYYARARNLHACAKAVANEFGGNFPEDEAELRRLPGIGAYTSAAIAAIAFGKKATPVDGNIERVVARLLAVEEKLPAGKKALARLDARASRRRFRAGHDGSRRHHLYAEEARLRDLSVAWRMRRARTRRRRNFSAPDREGRRRVAPRCCVRAVARRRLNSFAHAARARAARWHDRSADDGVER
jgi:endonuclease III